MEESNPNQRLEAIKDLIEKRPGDYLRMVEKAEKTLAFYLGTDYMKTNFAEEILHEVFCDLIDGTRCWDLDKYTIDQVVFMDIKSEISNLTKKEKRYITVNEYNENESGDNNNDIDSIINIEPEDIEGIIDAESIERYCFEKILNGDRMGQIILNEMLEGKTQKQIAEFMGITVEAAAVHIQRIRRKIRNKLPGFLLKNIPKELINKIQNNKRSAANDKK